MRDRGVRTEVHVVHDVIEVLVLLRLGTTCCVNLLLSGRDWAGVVSIRDAVVVRITLVGGATQEVNGQTVARSGAVVNVIGDVVPVAVLLRRRTALGVSRFGGGREVANIVGVHDTVIISVSF